MGRWKYLTMNERKVLAKMWQDGAAVPEIACELGVCERTIYRELSRGWDGGGIDQQRRRSYDPVKANDAAMASIRMRGRRRL